MVMKIKFEKIGIIYKFDQNDITNKHFQTCFCITKASTTKPINENMKNINKNKIQLEEKQLIEPKLMKHVS